MYPVARTEPNASSAAQGRLVARVRGRRPRSGGADLSPGAQTSRSAQRPPPFRPPWLFPRWRLHDPQQRPAGGRKSQRGRPRRRARRNLGDRWPSHNRPLERLADPAAAAGVPRHAHVRAQSLHRDGRLKAGVIEDEVGHAHHPWIPADPQNEIGPVEPGRHLHTGPRRVDGQEWTQRQESLDKSLFLLIEVHRRPPFGRSAPHAFKGRVEASLTPQACDPPGNAVRRNCVATMRVIDSPRPSPYFVLEQSEGT